MIILEHTGGSILAVDLCKYMLPLKNQDYHVF